MERISSYAALLLVALVCAFGPVSASRADDACDLVTPAELDQAFGIPPKFVGGRGRRMDNNTVGCEYVGRGATVFVTIVNRTLPPGFELAAWRARIKGLIQKECERSASAFVRDVTFEIVPDLGEDAYACSFDRYAVPSYLVGGHTMLHTVHGPNILQIRVSVRKPGLLQAMAVLTRSALPRLPR